MLTTLKLHILTTSWLAPNCRYGAVCFTNITSNKLLEVRKKHKLSFSGIGYKAFGTPGKVAVDFFLAFTQTIFVCAYVTFIVSSVNNILQTKFGMDEVNNWILGGAWFIIYVPLVFVRKIEKFAFFHIFADVAILVGLITITIYASMHLKDNNGEFSSDTELINTKTFLSFVGLASYTFEGIGIIIPVMETTSRPDLFPFILSLVLVILTSFYVFFGNFCYFIYGSKKLGEHPLITDIMPSDDWPIVLVKVMFIKSNIYS